MITTVKEIEKYLKRLFPISRSITGDGNRATLSILKEIIPLNVSEYPSGEKMYDWVVPLEWNIKSAWIKNNRGEKIIDFNKSNLHILNYSHSINCKVKFDELNDHLFFLRDQPDVIPYKTSYYKKNWGFCISYKDYLKFIKKDEEYEVLIDANLTHGRLTLADYVINGNKGTSEYFFSTYICHPSLANDNLSGILVCAFLAREISNLKLNNSYRFIFCPETIGAITYLSKNQEILKKCKGGYVMSCLAGPGSYSYKSSYLKNDLIDRVAYQTFREKNISFIKYPFVPQGSDERQYSSPGFKLPVGSLHKNKYGEYKEYHTSADNLDYISADNILKSIEIYHSIIENLEANIQFKSKIPFCEPKLDKYGLYPFIGRRVLQKSQSENNLELFEDLDIILWILFYGDGAHTLFEISEKHNISIKRLMYNFQILCEKGLIEII